MPLQCFRAWLASIGMTILGAGAAWGQSYPDKPIPELIALAKARPGELNYGSTSTGSANHLAAELFKAMAQVNIVRINYKGRVRGHHQV